MTTERTRIERYDPAAIEPRWQARWAELGLHRTNLDDPTRPKYYLLTMYDYPSGNLHVGHWYVKTPTDALARYHRMLGQNVLFPVGFDAFGVAGENAAIKNRIHPAEWTARNLDTMRRQLQSMGATFDWDAEVVTATPGYYRWNRGCSCASWRRAWRIAPPRPWTGAPTTAPPASRSSIGAAGAAVQRWRSGTSPSGTCGSPGTPTSCSTTGIEWPEPVRLMQTNWIGRSEGAEVVFRSAPDSHVAGRPSWSSAPEHPLVEKFHVARPSARSSRRTSSRPAARPRSSVSTRSATRRASPWAPTPSNPISTGSGSRSGSPTTSCPATGRARSWVLPGPRRARLRVRP